jgi:hypothetical protein
MSTEDAIKAKLGHIRDAVLKKLVADEEVRQALEKACKEAWKEACKQWMESVVEQAWDPRKALIGWAEMAVYPKHLLGTSEADAKKKATSGDGQYWPKEACESLIRRTLIDGRWGRGGGTVHAFYDFSPRIIGFNGGTGEPTSRHRAEITQGTPPKMHGHPKIDWNV